MELRVVQVVLEEPLATRVSTDARLTLLVKREYSFVWRTLRRFGVIEQDADDAAQRVFMVAAAKLDRIPNGRERAFLFGSAVRIANRERRRMRNRKDTPDVRDRESSEPLAEELVEQRRARELLDQLLCEMPSDLKAVFVLYEIEELTMLEIAALLQLRSGTVASRLRRARKRFAELLETARQRHEIRGNER